MKKLIPVLFSFLMWCVIAGMIGNEAQKAGLSPTVAEMCFLVLTLFTALLRMLWHGSDKATTSMDDNGTAGMASKADVAVEQWVNYILERLWKKNIFLNYAWSDDQYVVGGKIVHIPQPGTQPTVLKNNTSYPQVAVQRTDTDVTYTLDNYTTVPTHIPEVDLAIVSYDKIGSIIEDHYGYLLQGVADDIIYKWLNTMPNTNVIRTSGSSTAATLSGQTGNRLAMVAQDLQQARLLLNKQNISQEGRYALLQSDMLQQLVDSLSVTQYRDFSREYDAATGSIGKLFGFNILERSTTGMIQDNTTGGVVANDFLTAAGTTDDVVCICWQENSVARALGECRMFQRVNDPLYYGDIYSMLLRMGGRRRRADDAGIVAIVQTAA